MKLLLKLLTNHPLVNILFAVVLLMGLLSYNRMPKEQDPDINFNWLNINTVLPGASAANVEELVTGPLEDAIRTVPDIRFVSSTTREGVSNILVRFWDLSPRVFDKRVADIRREVQNKSNSELPEEAEDPMILEITTSSGFPTAVVVVTGQANDEELRQQARGVRLDLERLEGVDQVLAFGLHEPEIHVQFDPQALAARGLNAIDIADNLRSAFRDISAGTTEVGREKWSVQIDGATADVESLSEFRVAPSGNPYDSIRLGDIASVERAREEPNDLVSFNGQDAVSLSINKQASINTLELIQRVNDYIDAKQEVLTDSGIDVYLADDQTIQTRNALDVMQINALLGLLLVLLVCWLFLGFRIALMVTLGIAFSIAGAFWLLNLTGNTLNTAVLLGIVIVLGMLVDDAVVVVEAVYYRLRQGVDSVTAAIEGLREVAAPVTSAVATTMAAFLPLMLLPGIIGKFMFVIPFVVTVGLLVSLVEAFWILPAHVIGVSGRKPTAPDPTHWRNRWTHKLRIRYVKILCWVMRRPAPFLVAAVISFAMAIFLVATDRVKTEFFTFDPFRIFYINVDMPADTPIEETIAQTVRVENAARQFLEDGEIRAITSLSGVKFTEVEPL
ncbi:MAG: efflux RND transporter permease subunit, partial [Pseudomonadota bacterium]